MPESSKLPNRLKSRLSNLRSLHVFLIVYDAESVTRAAEMLNLTQPTVSIQLRQLAETIGTPLYHLAGKKMIFTQAADILAIYSREILSSVKKLEVDLAELIQLKAGTLKVAVVTSAKYFIPHLLGSFCKAYPSVDVNLKVSNREITLRRYEKGLDDLYLFSHLEPEMKPHAYPFLHNDLYPIASTEHPLASEASLEPVDLVNHEWLFREQGSGTRYATEMHFSELNLEVTPKLVIDSNEAIKHCVIAGMGIAVLSEYALSDSPSEQLVKLPVETFPIKACWHLVESPLRHKTPLTQAFIEYVLSQQQDLTRL